MRGDDKKHNVGVGKVRPEKETAKEDNEHTTGTRKNKKQQKKHLSPTGDSFRNYVKHTCFKCSLWKRGKGGWGIYPPTSTLHLPWLRVAPRGLTSPHLLLRREKERLGMLALEAAAITPEALCGAGRLRRVCLHVCGPPGSELLFPLSCPALLHVVLCFPHRLLYSSHTCRTKNYIQQTLLKIWDNRTWKIIKLVISIFVLKRPLLISSAPFRDSHWTFFTIVSHLVG